MLGMGGPIRRSRKLLKGVGNRVHLLPVLDGEWNEAAGQ